MIRGRRAKNLVGTSRKATIKHTEKYKAFDYLLEGCQVISKDYRYLYVNETVAKQGHNSKEELVGCKMTEMYPGIDKSAMFGLLKVCMNKGETQAMENEFRFPDGEVGWFELRMEPVPEGAIILSIDITDKKRSELKARQLDELKDMFIKVTSHQLRTPLSVIRWDLESLFKESLGILTPAQSELLHMIYDANVDIIDRVGDMITALDIEKSRIVLDKKPVSFESLWNAVYSKLKPACAHKKIHLTVKLSSKDLPPIICDSDMILFVMSRLVDNAVMYTPNSKSIKVNVTFKKTHGDSLRFEVTDEGIGIEKPEQAQVFTRFFRGVTALTINPDASGVSLSIAKYYIERHSGQIGFTSRPGKGSTFWFEIPLSEVSPGPSPKPPITPAA